MEVVDGFQELEYLKLQLEHGLEFRKHKNNHYE